MISKNAFQFRKAEESDLPFLMRLRFDAMRAHILNAGIEYDDQLQMERVLENFEAAQIVMLEGKDIGLLKVDRSRQPWLLRQIQLRPEYQRKGIGEKIIRQILGDAQKERVGVELLVLKNNPAKKLYERVGFTDKVKNGIDKSVRMEWKSNVQ